MAKRQDLKEAHRQVDEFVCRLNPPQIALDYIIHNSCTDPE